MKIKVLTFNTGLLNIFGFDLIPYVNERVHLIAQKLKELDADIICLQEVFSKKHFEILKKSLPDFKHFYSPKNTMLFNSGLCIFSRFEIANAEFKRFKSQINIEKLSGHGFQSVDIKIFDKVLRLFNCHLTTGGISTNHIHINSQKVGNKQLEELQAKINGNKNIILAGDFNSCLSIPSNFVQNIHERGFEEIALADNSTWSNDNELVKSQIKKLPNAQLDHLFFKVTNFVAEKFKKIFTEKLPQLPFNFSDHYGLMLELEVIDNLINNIQSNTLLKLENVNNNKFASYPQDVIM